MQLVVAEKPSVAREIARVLGVRGGGGKGVTSLENDRYAITWCIGHLVELEEPAAYNPAWKAWRLDRLPMLPEAFQLRPARHAIAQLRAVSKLLRDRRFTHVINACDAGREGELIFRYVYQHANSRLPMRRLWISSLTDDAIRRGFAALRAGHEYDALADAARSRSEADWLVGMNATRAITAHSRDAGHEALYSIGRVQTPTLAMLVEREREISAFVPRPYWELDAALTTTEGATFTARWRLGTAARLATASLAEAIVARDTAVGEAFVERVRSRVVREPAPQLFDLTSLQRTANRRFGFTASRTLELAQALYERHKIVSYPRTDSRYLSRAVADELAAPFAALAAVPEYAAFARHLVDNPPRPNRRIVDDSKVSDHHAIIPTGNSIRLGALDRDEARLFDLIARRFLGAFYPDAELAVTEAWLQVGRAPGAGTPTPAFAATDREAFVDTLPPPPDRYLARGRTRLVAGWQDVAGIGPEGPKPSPSAAPDEEREPTAALPPLVEGQRLAAIFKAVEKKTTPPPRYTDATLLGAMETAGKRVDDETLREAMRDTGLGTPATRAAIIETLLRRDYIVRDRQVLVPTPLGIGLISAIPVPSLASAELTGTWEARLARIARNEDSRAAFMADIARYVTDIINAIRSAAPPPAPPPGSTAPVGWSGGKRRQGRAWEDRPRKGRRRGAAGRARQEHGDRTARTQPPRGASRARDGAVDEQPSNVTARGTANGRVTSTGRRPASVPSPPPLSSGHRASLGDLSVESTQWLADAVLRTSRHGEDERSSIAEPHASPPRARAPDPTRRGAPTVDEDALLTCPRCRQGTLITGARGWGCDRWRDGCRFVIWFDTAGRRLTSAQLRALVNRGKTRKASFVDATGATIDGRLVLDPAIDGGARLEATRPERPRR
ncbi:MAG: DNA topoisomerase [Kofleriaceae bacterium]|nr:DNA topoisomerase [Kofleriaceae bacterium]